MPKPTVSNISYSTHERQVLDFWNAPSAAAGHPAPLVFYIYGGSWLTVSKEIINGCVDVNALLKVKISVLGINYRYVSRAKAADVRRFGWRITTTWPTPQARILLHASRPAYSVQLGVQIIIQVGS